METAAKLKELLRRFEDTGEILNPLAEALPELIAVYEAASNVVIEPEAEGSDALNDALDRVNQVLSD
jgi:hypothetical protein